jgi:hypothetical protein
MPPASSSSENLLATLDKAIRSSMNTDAKLEYYEEALRQEREQRKSDNESRLKEIKSWQGISETLSSQVTLQQNYLSDFDELLGSFSGSEAERHAAAQKALQSILDESKARDRERDAYQYAIWTAGGAAAGAIGGGFAGGGVGAAEGALIGACGGFAGRLVGKLTGWW